MNNSLRNKIALVLFFLLFLFGGAMLALYIVLGHGWNFAATEIDVGSGNMSNYMVIVLEGQSVPVKTTNTVNNTNTNTGAKSNANTNTNTNANANANANTNVNTSASANSNPSTDSNANTGSNTNSTFNTNANTNDNKNTNTNASTGGTGIRSSIQQFFNWDTSSDASEEDADAAKESSVVTDVSKAKDVGDAYANYVIKGADVLPLYSKDLSHYAQGEIYIKGDYKIGVLSITEPESYQVVQQKIDKLYSRGANLAVVLTKNSSYLALTHGVDVCIVLDGKTQVLETSVENRLFKVTTGVKGSINAIIFSPNHVITAKTI